MHSGPSCGPDDWTPDQAPDHADMAYCEIHEVDFMLVCPHMNNEPSTGGDS